MVGLVAGYFFSRGDGASDKENTGLLDFMDNRKYRMDYY